MSLTDMKPSKTLIVLVWLAIVPTLIGEFFKIQHWPGGAMFMVVGAFFFSFFYIPLYTIENWKTKKHKEIQIDLIPAKLYPVKFFGWLFI